MIDFITSRPALELHDSFHGWQIEGRNTATANVRYNRGMRLVSPIVLVFLFACAARSGEAPAEAYPLWDGRESVADYARRVDLPPAKTLDLGNDVKLELVLIPAGKFIMGTPEHEKPIVGQTIVALSLCVLTALAVGIFARARSVRQRPQFSLAFMLVLTFVAALGMWGGVCWNEALKYEGIGRDERPAHEVTITKPFYMGKFTVTQEQYQHLMLFNPSYYKGRAFPVTNVWWDDLIQFCEAVKGKSNLVVRLPTEAEWEYSCRAGTKADFHSGDGEDDLKRVGWYSGNSGNSMHPVGQKEPNAFGLYDMHGNVWQRCQDWYSFEYYAKSPAEDPQGPAQRETGDRVSRGGSFDSGSNISRSATRAGIPPDMRGYSWGFRVVVEPVSRTK